MIKVRAHLDPIRQMVYVHVINEVYDPPPSNRVVRYALTFDSKEFIWVPVAEGAESPWAYSFDVDIAKQVGDALAELYNRSGRSCIYREDCDRVLERVNKLLDNLNEVS